MATKNIKGAVLHASCPLALGQWVRDSMTGIEGFATQFVWELNGNRRVAIQPAAKEDGTLPEQFFYDDHFLIPVSAGMSAKAIACVKTDVAVGDKVRDKITGFKGVVTMKVEFINGCTSFNVVGEKLDENGKPIDMHLFVDRLEKTGVHKTLLPETQAKTGGPITRGKREKARR